jgi:hypothetical protein
MLHVTVSIGYPIPAIAADVALLTQKGLVKVELHLSRKTVPVMYFRFNE